MKLEWPTITLVPEGVDPNARDDEFPGNRREEARDRLPGAARPRIENEDPNAAENQPEPGRDPVERPPAR